MEVLGFMCFQVWKNYIYKILLDYFHPIGHFKYRRCRDFLISYKNGPKEYITVYSVTALAGYLYACFVALCSSDKWQKIKVYTIK